MDDRTDFEDLCEEERCLESKEWVDRMVEWAVNSGYDVSRVVHHVQEELMYATLDFREQTYIEQTFKDKCIQKFYNDVEKFLHENIKMICENLGDFIELIKKPSSLDEYFHRFPSRSVVSKCKMTSIEEEKFIQKLQQLCWKHVMEEVESLRIEAEFIQELEKYLDRCFLNNCPIFNNSVDWSAEKDTLIKSMIKYLHETDDESISSLASVARRIHSTEDCSYLFADAVKRTVSEYKQPLSITEESRNGVDIVQYQARCVDLQEVLDDIAKRWSGSFKEVNVIAQKLLNVNVSIALPGINLAVVTPTLHVSRSGVEWDVSGCAGRPEFIFCQAAGGRSSGEDGEAGLHGSHGESGGNVYIHAETVVNGGNLTIRSNGGAGTNGQHGGHGQDGQDGRDGDGMSESDFKSRFPETATYLSVRSGVFTCMRNMPEKTSLCRSQDEYKGKTSEGYVVHFCNYVAGSLPGAVLFGWVDTFGAPTKQAYCLVEGKDGTPGERGGDGGEGGKEGLAGYAGKVDVFPPGSGITVWANTGYDGKRGEDGKGGKGGRNGKKGKDCGRVEPNGGWADTRWFYADKVSMVFCSESSSETCWSTGYDKYVRLEATSVQTTYKQNGKIGAKKERKTQQRTRLRQTPISTDHIHHQMQLQRKENIYENLQLGDQIEEGFTFHQDKLEEIQEICIKRQVPIPSNEITQCLTKNINSHIPSELREDTKQKKEAEAARFFICEWVASFEIKRGQVCIVGEEKSLLTSDVLTDLHRGVYLAHLTADEMYHIQMILVYIRERIASDESKRLCDKITSLVINRYTTLQLRGLYKYTQSTMLSASSTNAIESHQHDMTLSMQLVMLDVMVEAVVEVYEVENLDTINSTVSEKANTFKKKLDIVTKFIAESNAPSLSVFDFNSSVTAERVESEDEAMPFEDTVYNDEMMETDGSLPPSLTTNVKNDIEDNLIRDLAKQIQRDLNHLPTDILNMVLKLRYLDSRYTVLLLQVLSKHLGSEPLQIPDKVLKWLISCIMNEADVYGIEDFLLIFAARPQTAWLAEYVTLQMREKSHTSFTEQRKICSNLRHANNQEMVLYLSQTLHKSDQVPSQNTVAEIVRLSDNIDLDDQICLQLQTKDMAWWPEVLMELQITLYLKNLSTTSEWTESEITEATFYICKLRNSYGEEIVNKLLWAVQGQQIVSISDLMDVLRNVSSSQWSLGDDEIKIIGQNECTRWKAILDKKFSTKDVRSIDQLTKLMNQDSNNSKFTRNSLDQTALISERIYTTQPSISANDLREWVNGFAKKATGMSLQGEKNQLSDDQIVESVSMISRAIEMKEGFHLRPTQIMAVVMFLKCKDHGMLEQIATGEGKTLIIVTLAIIKALLGRKVDVITSSSVLARRDAEIHKHLFELFGIKVGHNCSEHAEERKMAYTENQVVYGEIGAFQRDLLLDGFYNKDLGIGSRERGFVIVDEVDSMLLDKAENVLYLSHSISGMEHLEPVYIYIWKFVHSKDMVGTDSDVEIVQDCMLHAMHDCLTKKDIGRMVPEHLTEKVWKDLIDAKVIDKDGSILAKDLIMKNQVSLSKCPAIFAHNLELTILCGIKDVIRKGTLFSVPKFLQDFVNLHLQEWIENAFRAKWMLENDHYVVDVDRTGASCNLTPNIVIMDKDTGVEQYHSQWSNGLHQFLQLKHGCRLSYESLKAVFMSNVTFFKQYQGRLYGLTGTLGSKKERDLLQEMYKIEYATLPSFCPSQFVEEMAVPHVNEYEWLQNIKDATFKVCQATSKPRPVLIVAESVREVTKLQKVFEKAGSTDVHVYNRSYDPFDISSKSDLDNPCIMLATNLAGRGTDIKISDRMDEAGGLHVILTYLPSSLRVEQQAYGRAARKGQKGSGQMIYLMTPEMGDEITNISSIHHMKMRDENEIEKIEKIKTYYDSHILCEEKYFAEFQRTYCLLKNHLGRSENGKISDAIMLYCLDKWAFWLDEAPITTSQESVNASLQKFLRKLEEIKDSSPYLPTSTWTSMKDPFHPENSPSSCLKIAKVLMENKKFDEAEQLLDSIIKEDENFAEVALYYKCHVLLRKGGLENTYTRDTLFRHLNRTKALIKERCEQLSSFAAIIPMIAKSYGERRESFLLADNYAKQKEDVITALDAFTRSMNDIVGHGISPATLDVTFGNPINAQCAFDSLLENGILQRAKVSTLVEEDTWRSLADIYQLYFPDLEKTLEKNKGMHITPDTLQHILPSREEFWDKMLEAGLIRNEQVYVVMDKDALKAEECIMKKYKDMIDQIDGCDDLQVVQNKSIDVICLYPEQFNDKAAKLTVVPLDQFEKKFGKISSWTAIEEKGLIKMNRMANLYNIDDVFMAKYDGIDCNSFTIIDGLDQKTSFKIYNSLLKINVIGSDQHGRTKLLVKGVTPESITLQEHKVFETEVMNVVNKHFQYRLAYRNLLDGGIITLDSEPHVTLFNDLVGRHVIEPVKVKAGMKEADIQERVKRFVCCSSSEGLSSQLYSLACGIDKLDNVDSELIDVTKNLDKELTTRMMEDLAILQGSGFTHVISLTERKWTGTAICKMVAIVFIGLAQIALGVIIEVCSMGFMTHVASGLIGEGIGDIMFAIECAISGHCTWTEYYHHKRLSLAITVITCGIGAYFSRGAKFSKYGYKIGGEFLQDKAGKELLKEAGKAAVFKAAGMQVAKKVVEAGAIGLANAGVDQAMKHLLDSCMTKFSTNIVGDVNREVKGNASVNSALQELCKKVGITRAHAIMSKLTSDVFEKGGYTWHSVVNKIMSWGSRIGRSISSGLGQATKKLSRCGKWSALMSKLSTVISKVLYYAPKAKAVLEILTSVKEFMGCLEGKLTQVLSNLKVDELQDQSKEPTRQEYEEFVSSVTGRWQQNLTGTVKQKMDSEIVRPVLHDMSNTIVQYAGSAIKSAYAKYNSDLQRQQFEHLLGEQNARQHDQSEVPSETEFGLSAQTDSEYHKALTQLLMKTCDPHLFADIVREGVPLGIHSAQAVAEITGRPVLIKTIGGDGTRIMPAQFTPSEGMTGPPIELNFEVGTDGNIGHFSLPTTETGDGQQSMEGQRFDCLMEAVSQVAGNVTRDQIADKMESSELIRDRIERGIHQHFMGKGGVGGAERTQDEQKRKDAFRRQMKYAGKPSAYQVSYQFRDKAKMADEAVKATGNDEILHAQKIDFFRKHDLLEEAFEIRVDTKYVIFVTDKNGEPAIMGHTGALYSSADFSKTSQLVSGQHTLNKVRFADIKSAIDSGGSSRDVVFAGLNAHLGFIMQPHDLLNYNGPARGQCFTTSKHDLHNEADRKEFSIGYAREYYKIAAVCDAFRGSNQSNQLNNKTAHFLNTYRRDEYAKDIDRQVHRANGDLRKLGAILRKPAPGKSYNG